MMGASKRRGLLNRQEIRIGWKVFPLYCFVLPLLFGWLARVLQILPGTVNLWFYLLMTALVCILFRSFLKESFRRAMRRRGLVVRGLVFGICAGLLLQLLLRPGIRLVENWNTNQLTEQVGHAPAAVFFTTVFCAPLVEETFFRGLVFESFRNKSRLLAYVVTTGLFCLLHIWRQLIRTGDLWVFSLALDYIAPSVALIFCLEKSGTIWASVLLHAAANAAALISVYW